MLHTHPRALGCSCVCVCVWGGDVQKPKYGFRKTRYRPPQIGDTSYFNDLTHTINLFCHRPPTMRGPRGQREMESPSKRVRGGSVTVGKNKDLV